MFDVVEIVSDQESAATAFSERVFGELVPVCWGLKKARIADANFYGLINPTPTKSHQCGRVGFAAVDDGIVEGFGGGELESGPASLGEAAIHEIAFELSEDGFDDGEIRSEFELGPLAVTHGGRFRHFLFRPMSRSQILACRRAIMKRSVISTRVPRLASRRILPSAIIPWR